MLKKTLSILNKEFLSQNFLLNDTHFIYLKTIKPHKPKLNESKYKKMYNRSNSGSYNRIVNVYNNQAAKTNLINGANYNKIGVLRTKIINYLSNKVG